MCVLLRSMGRLGFRKPVNHTNLAAAVTLTDHPKRNCCVIEVFAGDFVLYMSFKCSVGIEAFVIGLFLFLHITNNPFLCTCNMSFMPTMY